jgi:hypothetical protein
VDHLGADGVGPHRLFGAQVVGDQLGKGRVGVAEAAQEARPRGSTRVVEQEEELAAVGRLGGRGGERAHDVKGVG